MKREGWDTLEQVIEKNGVINTLWVIAGIMDNLAQAELNPEYRKTTKATAEMISKCANKIWWRLNP